MVILIIMCYTSTNWEYTQYTYWTTSYYTSFQHYEYPKKEKEEKKKIDPNKEIIKHLTKICKNKKWV